MSILAEIFRPVFDLLAGIITFWYSLIPSYGVAIALLTVTVMVVLSPLTIKSTKSMLQMQALQPKLKELQKQHKGDRQAMAEAQSALFKEHKVSPAGGCLPMLLQFPLLIVMYDVIRGLTKTLQTKHGLIATPQYIVHSSLLYKHLVADRGVMQFLGLNLTVTPLHYHGGFFSALPYYLLVIVSVGLQYLQIQQIISKNPTAAAANPMASKTQQYSTLLFGLIYLDVPAGVVIYFLVSGLFRIVQQELMWRHDPVLRAHSFEARRKASERSTQVIEAKEVEPKEAGPARGILGKLLGLKAAAVSPESNPPALPPRPARPAAKRPSNRRKRRR